MRRLGIVLGGLIAASTIALVAPATAAPSAAASRWIVVLDDSAGDPQAVANEHARGHGAAIGHVYRHAIHGYAATMTPAAAARVAADPRVALVSPDGEVSIDAQTLPTGINRIDGELSSTVSGNGSGSVNVDVAVIDTGVDTTHPDLNVVGGVNCSKGNPRAWNDGNGHGTHVAGTIAAKDDGNGVVGVAPGARIWAVRVLNNSGSGSWSDIICGIDWVTARSATIEVANMSLGGSGSDGGCNADDAGTLRSAAP